MSFNQILEHYNHPLRLEDFNDEVRLLCNNCGQVISNQLVEDSLKKNTCPKCNTEGKLGRLFL